MPPRTPLRDRYAILALKDRGWSIRKIANEMNLRYQVVERWYNRETVNDIPRTGKYVSDREVRAMGRSLQKTESLRTTGKEFGHSHEFVRQKVRRSAANPHGLFPYKPIKVLRLTIGQKRKRKEYINTMPWKNHNRLLSRLKRKIIYDEKPFELGAPPNRQNHRKWAKSREQAEKYPMDKHPSKLMVMAAVGWDVKSDLYFYVVEGEYVKGLLYKYLQYIIYILTCKMSKFGSARTCL